MKSERKYIEKTVAYSGRLGHPRIMLREEDFRRIAESDELIYVRGRAILIETADKMLGQPPAEHVIPDGIRLLDCSRLVYRRLRTLCMAYRVTADEKYAKRAWLEMETVCAFADWNPYHFLDVGEMCNALGIAYDWIYDWMSEEQRATVRRALVEKGFEPAMDDYLDRERRRSYRWYQDDPGDNWKFVCNGGITVAALAICDEDDMDKEYLTSLLDYAFVNTYRAVRDMYMPDGSYVEGFTYWTYASEYLACYTEALKTATGTDFGLTDYEPVKKSNYYLKQMSSGRFYSFNFGDAQQVHLCSPVYMWMGHNYGAPEITNMRAEYLKDNTDEITVHDLMWYRPMGDAEIPVLPLDCGEVGATNASFRSGWGEGDLFGAIHFGDNNVCHAHADTGSFVVEWAKKRFICDLGQDNYNVKNYRRVYRYRAEGHNTLVINPCADAGQAQQSACYITDFRAGEGDCEPYVICNMTDAYFGKAVTRGMKLAQGRGAVVVQDEIKLDCGDVCYWYAHTPGNVTLCADGKSAIIDMDGDRMWVGVTSGQTLGVMAADYHDPTLYQEGQNDNSKFAKLYIKTEQSGVISVAFIPLSEGESEPKDVPVLKKLENW